GKLRGALSFAVARGLEGGVDTSRSGGALTLDGLWHYVRNVVRQRSSTLQAPVLFARAEEQDMVLFGEPTTAPPIALMDDKSGTLRPVAVFSLGAKVPLQDSVYVDDRGKADLIWDERRGQILDGQGNLLASNFKAADLQSALYARRLILFLQKQSEA